MSDDDPVERFVEETFDGEDDGVSVPQTRDMEAELRERTGVGADGAHDMTEVDSDTASAFWAAVVYVNVGVMLVALGPFVYVLRGRPLVSAGLVVAGSYALFRGYGVYRRFSAEDGEGATADAKGTDDGTETDDGAADDS